MLTRILLLFLLPNLMHNALVSSFECSCTLNPTTGSPSTEESTKTSFTYSTMHPGLYLNDILSAIARNSSKA
ncbi:unnamed protein product [Haemonchus placei]|uniref:Secreted protein n=1 Tax=Haemonchus placei TaxID=6290 RepID=A0A0N4X1S5_HAEPC|nr:unnamed protein product [Haemonchus placei]